MCICSEEVFFFCVMVEYELSVGKVNGHDVIDDAVKCATSGDRARPASLKGINYC